MRVIKCIVNEEHKINTVKLICFVNKRNLELCLLNGKIVSNNLPHLLLLYKFSEQ